MRDLRTMNLFAKRNDLKLAYVGKLDIKLKTNNLACFKNMILKHKDLYHDIDKWLETKVLPGIKNGERIAYIGLRNGIPIASAVLKLGNNCKFCHVSIDKEAQNSHFGEIIFSMMTIDANRNADNLYFTLPRSLWETKKQFFQSFGFEDASMSRKQYRHDEEELFCSAPFEKVWGHILEKLPKIINLIVDSQENIFNGLLLSIKPIYMDMILKGEKTVEIRRKFNSKWVNRKLILYSSSPVAALMGYASIDSVIEDTPEHIWNKFAKFIGGTRQEYMNYAKDAGKVYAIVLKEVSPFIDRITLDQIGKLLRSEIKPPQSYLSLENNSDWANAVSIAELLHRRMVINTGYME